MSIGKIGMSMYVQHLSLGIPAQFHIHAAQWISKMPLEMSRKGKVPRKRDIVFMTKQN
jgi:hypothetical protein